MFPTTNPTAIGRRVSLWYQTPISAQGIDLRKTTVSSQGIELRTEDLRIKTTYLPNKPPILATEATGCDRAWDRTEHPQDISVLRSAHREKKIITSIRGHLHRHVTTRANKFTGRSSPPHFQWDIVHGFREQEGSVPTRTHPCQFLREDALEASGYYMG